MLWLLALLPMIAGLLLLASGCQLRGILALAAVASLALTLLLAILAVQSGWEGRWTWSTSLVLQATLTPLSAVVAITVPAVGLPVLGYAAAHEQRPGLGRLVAGLLFFVGAMELVVIADDLLTLLLGWELVGACSWGLIAQRWREPGAAGSALYAFLVTRLGDLGMFLAAMAAFAGGHSLAYADLPALPATSLAWVAGGLLLSAAAKSGQVPFAPWLFRAMAGPTSVSALLHAATMVAAGAYLLARLQPTLALVPWFAPAVIAIGVTTALAGGIVALMQAHAKKLLAASTSAHFGLMWVAVGAGYPGVAIAHLVAHAAFKALLFLVAGIAGQRSGSYALASMQWGRALPWVAAASAIGALALAGVPPLGGAWTKEAIVASADTVAPWLALTVVMAGGLSAAYAARFQFAAFGLGRAASVSPPPAWVRFALAWLTLICVGLSVLWLPGVRASLAVHLAVRWPEAATWSVVASLLAVAVGLLAGYLLVRRYPALGQTGSMATAADWFGLPGLITHSVTVPCVRVAEQLSVFDTAVVDAGVRASAAFADWLASLGTHIGEFIVDGLPEGAAHVAGLAGREARRLQTGLSQHYYVWLTSGAVALAIILLWGS